MGSRPQAQAHQVHLVTQARRPMSEDIAFRQRRYLLMMGIRALCFVAAVLMFVNHLGWLAAIPAVGAIVLPYFAVVFANGGREPDNTRGFLEYRANLPARRAEPRDGDLGLDRTAPDASHGCEARPDDQP